MGIWIIIVLDLGTPILENKIVGLDGLTQRMLHIDNKLSGYP